MTPPVLHKARAAGKIVGKSASWMYQKGAAGEIPRTKIGHNVRWTDEQLAQIIRDGAQQPKQRTSKQREAQPSEQRRKPQPAKRAPQRKRQPASPATSANIPQADFNVSRLYRKDGAA